MLYIFLLHGLGATPITLWPLEQYLSHVGGYENTHRISYPVDQLNFQDSIDFVDKQMKMYATKDIDDIILIGQSMGGVVANNMHTKGWNIKKAVYIGAPLHGARLLTQLNNYLPKFITNFFHKKPYDFLMTKTKEQIPPHDYHTISMSWPGTDFDGCVYKDETILSPQNHTHIAWADHRTVFANWRLWSTVLEKIK
jgi:esterase/lipase